MKCPNCGTECTGKFCKHCGTKLNPPEAEPMASGFRVPSETETFGVGFQVPDPTRSDPSPEPDRTPDPEPVSQTVITEADQTPLDPAPVSPAWKISGDQTPLDPVPPSPPVKPRAEQVPHAPAAAEPEPTPFSPAPEPAAPAAPPVPAPAVPTPAAPAVPTPVYPAANPAAPVYGAPAVPTYGAPVVYGAPAVPTYGAPVVYGAPVPVYGTPAAYGAPVPVYGTPAAYGAPVPPYMPPVYPPRNRFGGQGQRPVSREGRRVARRLGSSPAYLIAAVAFTLYMLLYTVFAVRVIGILTGAERYWHGNVISGLFSERISEREAVMWVVYCGLSVLFSVLIAAGLWITFGSAVKRGSDRMSGAGLTMIKVVTIIRLVLFCIFFAIVLFGALIGGLIQGAVNDAFEFAELREVGILYFLLMTSILVGVMVMGILYYAGILRTLNAVRSSLQTGIPNPGASGYVAVMNFLMTTGLLYLTLRVFRTDGALFGLALLCLCVSLCTFGVCIFQYRGAMAEAAASDPENL